HLKTFVTQAGLQNNFVESITSQIRSVRQYLDPLSKVSPLTDGEYLPLAGERLRALHTPGHSNGHVSFYHEDGVLVSGDLLLEGICEELYQNLDDLNRMLALSEVIGHLDLLAEEKRLAITRKKGVLQYKVK